MSLFGGSGAVASQTRSRNLVEFKAGKMNLRGTMVYPDKRKGLVYLHQGNDMLMHLCWKDRSSSSVEDDLVIFPEEIEFKKVTQNTTGRVYVLKWRSNARKLFFWMQEPKDDKDAEFCKKINDLLNNPPSPGFDDDSSGAGSTHPLQPLMERMAGGGAGGMDPTDLSNVLRGMDPSEFASLLSSFRGGGGGAAGLMQSLHRGRGSSGRSTEQGATSTTRSGGSSARPRNGGTSSSASATVPTTTASATASSGSKTNPIQISALTNVLANLGNSPIQGTETAGNPSKPPVDLYEMISSDNLIPLLSKKTVQEKLRVYLPEGDTIPNTEKELRESAQSPQFRQIVNAFSMALQSGELGPILTQSGFPDDVIQAASQGDLQAFVKAIEKHYQASNEEIGQEKSSDNTMDTN